MQNTQDLSDFGFREKEEAKLLLSTYGTSKDKTLTLGLDLKIEFNPMSGYVFLVDEDFNCAMMNGDILENWHNCPNCGNEGISSEFLSIAQDDCCKQYANELGLLDDYDPTPIEGDVE